MDYRAPHQLQCDFLNMIVAASEPELARALESQFQGALVAPEDHCSICFTLELVNRTLRLPSGCGKPLIYGVWDSNFESQATEVLLWHEHGFVDAVEISWVGDEHPELNKIFVQHR
ncbi:hypothetical protein [Glutamicibacter sp. NPDC087344]|uniref:hypothetical protein n=1 Tax=Glutamicibacter sp. NPDC087344 TaxID=3363994 RepID=UPI003800EAA8